MKRLLGLALLVAGAQLAAAQTEAREPHPTQEKTPYARRFGLSIGVATYTEHPALPYADDDARIMARLGRERGFDTVTLLTNEEATRSAITNAIAELAGRVQGDDLTVIFFSGHGVRTEDRKGGYSGYLLPYGCRKGHEAEDGMAMAKITALIGQLPNRYQTFVVDACYSGLMADELSQGRPPADDRVLRVVTSADSDQWAFESDGHGLLTGAAVRALQGRARRLGEGWRPGKTLVKRIEQDVKQETGGWQTPRIVIQGGEPQTILLKRF